MTNRYSVVGSLRLAFGLAIVVIASIVVLTPTSIALAGDPLGAQLAQMRAATASFHQLATAQAAGYTVSVPGCYELPGTGGMGYHFANFGAVDLTVDFLHPEVMVYAPGPNGQLQLGAVEYLVPRGPWDAGHSQPPQLFGHTFEYDSDFDVYALHAWIWKHNPSGMFEPWNPKVTCR
ncbi:MAG: hypothetical protein HZB51_12575 [Chloroflexi bacterium]|nr:hypothetical protein [Chloroflexota bacterium]